MPTLAVHWRSRVPFMPLLTAPAVTALMLACLLGCAQHGPITRAPAPASERLAGCTGRGKIAQALDRHIRVLASDEFEGRLPGTKGDSLTVAYLLRQYRSIGLAPVFESGQYIQAVPLLNRRVDATATVRAGGRLITLSAPRDIVMRDAPIDGPVALSAAGAVFVGYGIVSPQNAWDDYKGHDVAHQVVLMLAGRPGDASQGDSTNPRSGFHWGPEATSDGKVALAKSRGAMAVVLVHDSAVAGYPFDQVTTRYGERAILPDTARVDTTALGFVSLYLPRLDAAAILSAGGQDLDSLERQALHPAAATVALDLRVELHTEPHVRRFTSANVIGSIEGSDPLLRHEVIVYTAHWDHLGRDTTLTGDQIYNGAVDNGGGVAQLLEIARRFAEMRPRPRRTVIFIATTAEEAGLLGAAYYVAHPAYDLAHTLANINLDFFLPWGCTRDVINYGPTGTTLDDVFAAAAHSGGRTVTPDPTPEEHYFERGDQYPFALAGVPAMFPAPGTHYVGQPEGYGQAKIDEYIQGDYHQVSDEVREDWDLSGAVQEIGLLTRVGVLVADGSLYPTWKDSTMCPACRAHRAASLGTTKRQ